MIYVQIPASYLLPFKDAPSISKASLGANQDGAALCATLKASIAPGMSLFANLAWAKAKAYTLSFPSVNSTALRKCCSAACALDVVRNCDLAPRTSLQLDLELVLKRPLTSSFVILSGLASIVAYI